MLLAADLDTPSRFWLFEAVTSIHGHLLSCISKETEFVRELDLDDLPRQHQGDAQTGPARHGLGTSPRMALVR